MVANHTSLLVGALIGLSVAVPIGPMGLLCIQRTLVSGLRVGVCTGLGAATVNVTYGALIIAGLDTIAPLMATAGRVLGIAGGLFLFWCAARTFQRRQFSSTPSGQGCLSPTLAYGSAVAFNLGNPMSPIAMLALLSPVMEMSGPSSIQAALLLIGMFAAAASWWVCLAGGVSLLRSRLTPGMLVVANQLAGVMLTIYGAVALARSAGM